jgi:hypothetical protein
MPELAALEIQLRDMREAAIEKLGHVEKLKASGEFVGSNCVDLLKMERTLRAFAGMEEGSQ